MSDNNPMLKIYLYTLKYHTFLEKNTKQKL